MSSNHILKFDVFMVYKIIVNHDFFFFIIACTLLVNINHLKLGGRGGSDLTDYKMPKSKSQLMTMTSEERKKKQ